MCSAPAIDQTFKELFFNFVKLHILTVENPFANIFLNQPTIHCMVVSSNTSVFSHTCLNQTDQQLRQEQLLA